MQKRSFFQKIFGNKPDPNIVKPFELINNSSSIFYPWNGNLFDSDIVRSAIRPKATAVGKLNAVHISGSGITMKRNPSPYIKAILDKPNPFMSMQDFLMKMTYQRELTHNAFAYVKRDDANHPLAVYPVPFTSVELVESADYIFVKFRFRTGKFMTVPYEDVIHLRKDFNDHDFYGDDGNIALQNIMNVITTTDQGIVTAIKNSAIVKWILMFKNVLQPKDKEIAIKDFIDNYLSITKGSGAAATDPRYELKQVEDKPFVPNATVMDKSIQRLYSYFGVNDDIVQNKYNEEKWNAFYESEIEPLSMQFSTAFTFAFFSSKERAFGNTIIFEANNLAYASMKTKLELVSMVDRGAMTPNEWRAVLNLGPIEGGDKPIRRLDTALVDDKNKLPNEDGDTSGK